MKKVNGSSLSPPPAAVFITGTDTGVGKTIVSAWLLQQWNGAYWKPIQSGLDGETDTALAQRLSGLPKDRFHPCTFELTPPRSPHEAARHDGISIALNDFKPPIDDQPLIVEGAGGVLVPLNDTELMIDLMVHLQLPVILVARTTLGTINHTLLSLSALRGRGLPLLGVILNGPEDAENRQAIIHYGKVPVLAEIPPLQPLDRNTLQTARWTVPD